MNLPADSANLPVTIAVKDQSTGKAMAGRIHLKDSEGKPVRGGSLPFFRDHFVCDGEARLEVPAGSYSLEVERGPEFSAYKGTLVVAGPAGTNATVTLSRIADMAGEGWWSGETHVHRPPEDVEMLMRAEDLHMAQVITWWKNRQGSKEVPVPAGEHLRRFDGNRYYHMLAGEDERDGGALLYFNLERPLDLNQAKMQFPSSIIYAAQARLEPGAWIDMEKPFWWDFPIWVASGLCDSVGLANNHMCRSEVRGDEAWGHARDRDQFPGTNGNGLWSQQIYYHVLNCGLRIPPSAGSASGVLPNPVGYNRVYVQLGPELTYEKWWDGLKAGCSFVSNGPLLRCKANGELPGHVFSRPNGSLSIGIDIHLTSREPIAALEVICNGAVIRKTAVAAGDQRVKLELPAITESGWFLMRAISDEPRTFRFASTAPFYVEIDETRRHISKRSAQFFVDWVREGMKRIQLTDPEQRDAVLKDHRMAEKFWSEIATKGNAE